MAKAYNKFEAFVEDLANGLHDLFTGSPVDIDDIEVYLSNAAPNAAAHRLKADVAEIALANGYAGPVSVTPVGTRAGGTFTLSGTKVTITAAAGPIAEFQVVVLINGTAVGTPLISWWDYGAKLNLADGESLEIKFNSAEGSGTIFTLT